MGYYAYDKSFNDYVSYSENDIVNITEKGISLRDGNFIDFCECAENYGKAHDGSRNCIAERFSPIFVFYTKPKPTRIVFKQKSRIREFFLAKPTHVRVYNLKKKIEEYGFSTCDMT